jgi:hypothetical protein
MLLPSQERSRKVRGIIDLLTGRYPRFLFGGSVGDILPVFHFHELSPEDLAAKLLYLAENGYRTVTSDAISRFVRNGTHPGRFTVALCFDDALASLWSVAGPLLRKFGFSAITYAIPARIAEASTLRPTLGEGVTDVAAVDRSDTPFVTWPELRSLHTSGVIDVQGHTYSHSMVFCSNHIVGFVTPNYVRQYLLSRPLISSNGEPTYLSPSDLGAPIYPQRTRMSDGFRLIGEESARQRCMEYVKAAGGVEFFSRLNWRNELRSLVNVSTGAYESAECREKAIYEELQRGRAVLNERLGTDTVRHMCFPWGIAGQLARRAARHVGYETAFGDRWFGMRSVRRGENPYSLMRLPNRYIFSLPGRGRRIFLLGG